MSANANRFGTKSQVFSVFVRDYRQGRFHQTKVRIPFRIRIVIIQKFRVQVSLAIRVRTCVTMEECFFNLQRHVNLTYPRTRKVFLVRVVFRVRTKRRVIFPSNITSFKATSVRVVVCVSVCVVVLRPRICGPAQNGLVDDFNMYQVSVLNSDVLIRVLLGLRPTKEWIIPVVMVVGQRAVRQERIKDVFRNRIMFHDLRAIICGSTYVTRTSVKSFFRVIFRTMSRTYFCVGVVFIRYKRMTLLEISPGRNMSIFHFHSVISTTIQLMSFRRVMKDANVRAW